MFFYAHETIYMSWTRQDLSSWILRIYSSCLKEQNKTVSVILSLVSEHVRDTLGINNLAPPTSRRGCAGFSARCTFLYLPLLVPVTHAE